MHDGDEFKDPLHIVLFPIKLQNTDKNIEIFDRKIGKNKSMVIYIVHTYHKMLKVGIQATLKELAVLSTNFFAPLNHLLSPA